MVRRSTRDVHDVYADLEAECQSVIATALAHPRGHIRWMVPQEAFRKLPGRFKLYRAGNQALGKTTVGLAEVIDHCLGQHAYRRVKKPPVHWVVCSLNQSQSLGIQEKFHALIGVGELAEGCTWNPKTGYGANKPVSVFANGSTVRWVTDDQGPRAVAGLTLDGVLVDEPCSDVMLRELRKRLLRKRGTLLVTMTPINGRTGIEHFREEVKQGLLAEIPAPLTPENLRFADTGEVVTLEDGTACDAAWIEEIKREAPPLYADIVNNGGWETLVQGVFFSNFDARKHVSATTTLRAATGRLRWLLGIDYAAADREFGQVAVLCQVLEVPRKNGDGSDWWVYVVDEVVCAGTVDSADFADQLVGMLARWRLEWHQLDAVHGDNPVSSRYQERSNILTTKALALRLRRPIRSIRPAIQNAKEGVRSSSSKDAGCRFIYGLIARGRFMVHPRCTHLIKGLQTWDYSYDHPYKDVLDALRYGLKPAVFPHGGLGGLMVRVAV